MKKEQNRDHIVIYQSKSKNIKLDVVIDQETVWLTQAQMTKLLGRDRSVLAKHINNIFQVWGAPLQVTTLLRAPFWGGSGDMGITRVGFK